MTRVARSGLTGFFFAQKKPRCGPVPGGHPRSTGTGDRVVPVAAPVENFVFFNFGSVRALVIDEIRNNASAILQNLI